MTVERIAEVVEGKILAPGSGEISAFYAGDFLSHVMAGAPPGCAWATIMNNINVAGVAVIADIRVVIVCDSIEPVPDLIEKCKGEGIMLISSRMPVFECCAALGRG